MCTISPHDRQGWVAADCAFRQSSSSHPWYGERFAWGQAIQVINSIHELLFYAQVVGETDQPAQNYIIRKISYSNPFELIILVPAAACYGIMRLVRKGSRLRAEIAKDNADIAKAKVDKLWYERLAKEIESDLNEAPKSRTANPHDVGVVGVLSAIERLSIQPADRQSRRIFDEEKDPAPDGDQRG